MTYPGNFYWDLFEEKNGLVRSRSELKKWPKLELELGELEWLQILKSVAKWWFQSLFSCTLCLRTIQFDDNLMKTVQLCTSSVTLGIFQIIASSHRFYLHHDICFFIICFQIERKKNLERTRLWISPCNSHRGDSELWHLKGPWNETAKRKKKTAAGPFWYPKDMQKMKGFCLNH